jgi:hypothetical protein
MAGGGGVGVSARRREKGGSAGPTSVSCAALTFSSRCVCDVCVCALAPPRNCAPTCTPPGMASPHACPVRGRATPLAPRRPNDATAQPRFTPSASSTRFFVSPRSIARPLTCPPTPRAPPHPHQQVPTPYLSPPAPLPEKVATCLPSRNTPVHTPHSTPATARSSRRMPPAPPSKFIRVGAPLLILVTGGWYALTTVISGKIEVRVSVHGGKRERKGGRGGRRRAGGLDGGLMGRTRSRPPALPSTPRPPATAPWN